MKLVKYPQSCLLLEKEKGRVLIDPGTPATNSHSLEDFGKVDAVLYTHRHADHLDIEQVEGFLENGADVYGNSDVCAAVGDAAIEVRHDETFSVADFLVRPLDLPHFVMVDGSAGPPNTGFVFDDQLFHPGDGLSMDGLTIDVLAVPIAGPSVSFHDAYKFVKQTAAEQVVPIHYDTFVADPNKFAGYCDLAEVLVLQSGESVEI